MMEIERLIYSYESQQGCRSNTRSLSQPSSQPPALCMIRVRRETPFLSHLYIVLETIILPRRARDRQRKWCFPYRALWWHLGEPEHRLCKDSRAAADRSAVGGAKNAYRVRHFVLTMIALPRQARDKHRGKTSTSDTLCAGRV
jgi:hypothetical protein